MKIESELEKIIENMEDEAKAYEVHWRTVENWMLKLIDIKNEIRALQTQEHN